jgi:hypothetical protein
LQKSYGKFKSFYSEDKWIDVWLEAAFGYSEGNSLDTDSVFDCIVSTESPREKSIKIIESLRFGLLLCDFVVLENLFNVFNSADFAKSKYGKSTLREILSFEDEIDPSFKDRARSNVYGFLDNNAYKLLCVAIENVHVDIFKLLLDFFLEHKFSLVNSSCLDPYSCNNFRVPLLEKVSLIMKDIRSSLVSYRYNMDEGAVVVFDPIYKILNLPKNRPNASKDIVYSIKKSLKKKNCKYVLFKKYFYLLEIRDHLLLKIGHNYVKPLVANSLYSNLYWLLLYLGGDENLDVKNFSGFSKLFSFLGTKKDRDKRLSSECSLTYLLIKRLLSMERSLRSVN